MSTKNSKKICTITNFKSHWHAALIKLAISATSQHCPIVRILREPVLNCVTQNSELWARGGEGRRLNPHTLGDGKESEPAE